MADVIERVIVEAQARGNIVDGGAEKATDDYGAATERADRKTKRYTRSQKGLSDSTNVVSRSMRNQVAVMGSLVAGFATLQTAKAVLSGSVSVTADFGATLSEVQAVAGATTDEMARLTAQAKDLGASTKFSAVQAGEGMSFLGRAGFETSEILRSMPGLLDLAAAGGLDLASSADIASNVLSGFNLQASEAGRVADVLAKTAASSNTSVEQLGQGMRFAAPVAAALGVDLETLAAAAGKLGDSGIQGSVAGQQLKIALRGLAAPTNEAIALLERYDLTAESINPQMNSLSEVIQRLAEANIDAADTFRIFGSEAAPGILALTASADDLVSLEGRIRDSDGAAAEMASTMNDNLRGSLTELSSTVESVKIAFGERLAPVLRDIITDLREFLSDNTSAVRAWGDAFATAVNIGAKPLLFLLKNLELVRDAMLALIAVSAVQWFTATAAGTHLLALAQTDLATAVWAVRSGYAKLVLMDIGSKLAGWAARAASFVTKLHPATLVVGAIGAAFVIAGAKIRAWANESEREMARIIKQGERVKEIVEQTNSVLEQNSMEAVGRQLDANALTISTKTAEVAAYNDELKRLGFNTDGTVSALDVWKTATKENEERAKELKEKVSDLNVEIEALQRQEGPLVDAYAAWHKWNETVTRSTGGAGDEVEELAGSLKKLEAEAIRQESVVRAMDDYGLSASHAGKLVDTLISLQEESKVKGLDAARAVSELLLDGSDVTIRQVIELVTRISAAEVAARKAQERLNKLLNISVQDIVKPLETIQPIPATPPVLPEVEPLADETGKINDNTRETVENYQVWGQLANELGFALSGIDSSLANILSTALRLVQSFKELRESSGGIQGALAGARFGNDLGALGRSLGLFGDRGVGRFGGSRGGDYGDDLSALGGAIGGAFGPVGGMIGSGVGALFGSTLKRDLEFSFAQVKASITGQLQILTTDLDESVREAHEQFTTGLSNAFASALEIAGVGLSGTSNLAISASVQPDFIQVFVDGIEHRFQAIDEAILFATQELLKRAEVSGAGANVQHVLSSGLSDSLEELGAVLDLARRLDESASGFGSSSVAQSFREIASLRSQEAELALKHGLALEGVIRLGNERIAQLRAEVEAQYNALVGGRDYLAQIQEFENSVRAFNAGRAEEISSRNNLIAAYEAEAEKRDELSGRMNRGVDRGIDAAGELASAMGAVGVAAASSSERLSEMDAALAELPDAIDVERIADAWRATGSQAASDLISLLQQVRGESFLAQEARQAQANLYALQLAAQISSVQNLLAATSSLDAATRSLLTTIVEAANETLAGVLDGSLRVGGGGGGGQRRAAREAFREDLALMASGLDVIGGYALEISNMRDETAEVVAEMSRHSQIQEHEIALYRELRQVREDLIAAEAEADLLTRLARIIGDEQLLADLQTERQRLEIANIEIQARALHELGAITDASFANILNLVGRAYAALEDVVEGPLPVAVNVVDLIAERLAALNQYVSLGDSLLNFVSRYYGEIEAGESFRRNLEELRFELEVANFQTQIDLLQATGHLSEAQLAHIQSLIDFVRNNPPDWDAFFSPTNSTAFAPTSNPITSATSSLDSLSSVLDRITSQTEAWLALGVDPLQSALDAQIDTFVRLRDELIAAGGSLDHLIELEAALAHAREAVWQSALDRVRDALSDSEVSRPGLLPGERLDLLTSQFQSALSGVLADPSQAGIDQVLSLYQQLQQFGGEFMTGHHLEAFLNGLDAQLSQILGLELPDPDIPPPVNVGSLPPEIGGSLLSISAGIADQNPILDHHTDQLNDIGDSIDSLATNGFHKPLVIDDSNIVEAFNDGFHKPLMIDPAVTDGLSAVHLAVGDLKTTTDLGLSAVANSDGATATLQLESLTMIDQIRSELATISGQQRDGNDSLVTAFGSLEVSIDSLRDSVDSLRTSVEENTASNQGAAGAT